MQERAIMVPKKIKYLTTSYVDNSIFSHFENEHDKRNRSLGSVESVLVHT